MSSASVRRIATSSSEKQSGRNSQPSSSNCLICLASSRMGVLRSVGVRPSGSDTMLQPYLVQPYTKGNATLGLSHGVRPRGSDTYAKREALMQDKPEKKTPRTLRLNARDNIIVAVDSVMPGVVVQGVAATGRIMRGHKMAAEHIATG